MAKKHVAPEVLPIAQAREEFSAVVRRFREQGILAAPMVCGSHRKPEAVTIPYDLYVALADIIEDIHIAEIVRSRAGQPLIEWHDALERLGITQEQVDSVDMSTLILDVN